MRPSMPSHTAATRSAQRAGMKRPSDESEMDVMPAHAARDVTRFGMSARTGILSDLSRRRRCVPLNLKRLIVNRL